MAGDYVWQSSYVHADNNPINKVDHNGEGTEGGEPKGGGDGNKGAANQTNGGVNPTTAKIENSVTGITKNKDNSYTIKEKTTITQTLKTDNLTATKGDITYSATKTVKSVTTIETITNLDAKGNVLSSSSEIDQRESTYMTPITATNNKTGRSETISQGYGESQYIGSGSSTTFKAPFAATAESSLKSGLGFPIMDDADYKINLEFGYISNSDLAPIFKAAESEEERFYQNTRKATIILQDANKYNESLGSKLQDSRFKNGYSDIYQKNQNRVMTNPNAFDYSKNPTKSQLIRN